MIVHSEEYFILYLQEGLDGVKPFLVTSPLCVSVSQTGSNTGDNVTVEYDANDHTNQCKGHLSMNE